MESIKFRVLDFISRIPKGKVTNYDYIAKKLKIKSARLVGQILHKNPDPQKYPCHRVVFADGGLSSAYAFGGAEKQREKLLREGITFSGNKVNQRHFIDSL